MDERYIVELISSGLGTGRARRGGVSIQSETIPPAL